MPKPEKTAYRGYLVWGFLMLLAGTFPGYCPTYFILSATSIFMYAILSLSWTIFSGPTGYVSLATATFYGIGIYTTALLGDSLPFPLLVFCGGLAAALIGVVVGLICLRLNGFYFAVFTFGLNELIRHSMLWWEHNISGTVGRWVVSTDALTLYYTMLAITVLTMAGAFLIDRSKFGLALKAIGESEDGAEHVGINVTMHRISFFAISCSFMGMAGAAMATKFTYIDPNSAFSPLLSFTPVLMSLFGGTGKVYGPVLGASLLTLISEVLLSKFPYFYTLIYGIIFILVILFLPSGLTGVLTDRSLQKAEAS